MLVEFEVCTPAERRRLEAYFLSHAQRNPENGCLEWRMVTKRRFKYGDFTHGRVKVKAHRFSWWLKHGEIPPGLFVCHKCDNPACIDPEHLFLGTASDNTQDMLRKGRHKRR